MQVERQLQILSLLNRDRVAQVSELSRRFGVSQNTIRRDLKLLAGQGLVSITHGGAFSKGDPTSEMTFQTREDRFAEEKRKIGAMAAELIEDGEAIIIDAGTTTARMIPALRGKHDVTVITNAINIALGVLGLPGITTVLSGGIVNEITRCTAGFHAEEFIGQFHVGKAFIGTGGITVDGLTNTNAFEVQMKREMIKSAEKVVLVVTHDKIGQVTLAPFAPVSSIHTMITGSEADARQIDAFRQHGVEVILC